MSLGYGREDKVHKTTEYELFYLEPSNRPINQRAVLDLVESILEKNMLAQYPILVSPEGKIKDGQHRVEAVKRIHEEHGIRLTIYYIVDEDSDVTDIALANAASRRWRRGDFIRHYSMNRFREYQWLEQFIEDYDWMSASVACALAVGRKAWRKLPRKEVAEFNRGKFRVTHPKWAREMANMLDDLIRESDVFRAHDAYSAASEIIMSSEGLAGWNPDYDHEEMLHKIGLASHLVQPQVDREAYKRMLEDIYNYRRHGDRIRLF